MIIAAITILSAYPVERGELIEPSNSNRLIRVTEPTRGAVNNFAGLFAEKLPCRTGRKGGIPRPERDDAETRVCLPHRQIRSYLIREKTQLFGQARQVARDGTETAVTSRAEEYVNVLLTDQTG